MRRNKVLFTFKIQSFSDVITNSSSELFVVGDVNKTAEEIKKMLIQKFKESGDTCSGMGGYIEVTPYDAPDNINDFVITSDNIKFAYHIKNWKKLNIPQKGFFIYIDNNLCNTIEFIRNELKGFYLGCY